MWPVTYDFALERKESIELPKPSGSVDPHYATPVQVGETTLIAYVDIDRSPELDNYGGSSVLELDPVTGAARAELGAPAGYIGRRWFVGRVDKVGTSIGAQVRVECTEVVGEDPPPACVPMQTWQNGGGSWTKVQGAEGRDVYWQSAQERVSWTVKGVAEGLIEYDAEDRHRVLAPETAWSRMVAGSLLEPRSCLSRRGARACST